MSKKQTLYEVLSIAPTASGQEIQAAYHRALQALQCAESDLSREDFNFKVQILNLARSTLADPDSRSYYDAKLASETELKAAIPSASNAMALHTNADSLAHRADALSLRADALALRAEAMSIRADLPPLHSGENASSFVPAPLFGQKSPLRRIVIVLGTVAAVLMVIQLVFTSFSVSYHEQAARSAAKAEEQIIIQEYYQTYGVRPASAAEARLMEAENRRKETERRTAEREKQLAQRAKLKAEEDYRRSQEEVLRLANQVSADLYRAEEAARREEERAEAQKRERLRNEAIEARRKEEAENLRVQREREKWQRILAEE